MHIYHHCLWRVAAACYTSLLIFPCCVFFHFISVIPADEMFTVLSEETTGCRAGNWLQPTWSGVVTGCFWLLACLSDLNQFRSAQTGSFWLRWNLGKHSREYIGYLVFTDPSFMNSVAVGSGIPYHLPDQQEITLCHSEEVATLIPVSSSTVPAGYLRSVLMSEIFSWENDRNSLLFIVFWLITIFSIVILCWFSHDSNTSLV